MSRSAISSIVTQIFAFSFGMLAFNALIFFRASSHSTSSSRLANLTCGTIAVTIAARVPKKCAISNAQETNNARRVAPAGENANVPSAELARCARAVAGVRGQAKACVTVAEERQVVGVWDDASGSVLTRTKSWRIPAAVPCPPSAVSGGRSAPNARGGGRFAGASFDGGAILGRMVERITCWTPCYF